MKFLAILLLAGLAAAQHLPQRPSCPLDQCNRDFQDGLSAFERDPATYLPIIPTDECNALVAAQVTCASKKLKENDVCGCYPGQVAFWQNVEESDNKFNKELYCTPATGCVDPMVEECIQTVIAVQAQNAPPRKRVLSQQTKEKRTISDADIALLGTATTCLEKAAKGELNCAGCGFSAYLLQNDAEYFTNMNGLLMDGCDLKMDTMECTWPANGNELVCGTDTTGLNAFMDCQLAIIQADTGCQASTIAPKTREEFVTLLKAERIDDCEEAEKANVLLASCPKNTKKSYLEARLLKLLKKALQ